MTDAILIATDAASVWILDELEDGETASEASPLKNISPEPGGFVKMLQYSHSPDCHFHRTAMGNVTVRLCPVSIRQSALLPGWLSVLSGGTQT